MTRRTRFGRIAEVRRRAAVADPEADAKERP
jgi:hypothetical protein